MMDPVITRSPLSMEGALDFIWDLLGEAALVLAEGSGSALSLPLLNISACSQEKFGIVLFTTEVDFIMQMCGRTAAS